MPQPQIQQAQFFIQQPIQFQYQTQQAYNIPPQQTSSQIKPQIIPQVHIHKPQQSQQQLQVQVQRTNSVTIPQVTVRKPKIIQASSTVFQAPLPKPVELISPDGDKWYLRCFCENKTEQLQ